MFILIFDFLTCFSFARPARGCWWNFRFGPNCRWSHHSPERLRCDQDRKAIRYAIVSVIEPSIRQCVSGSWKSGVKIGTHWLFQLYFDHQFFRFWYKRTDISYFCFDIYYYEILSFQFSLLGFLNPLLYKMAAACPNCFNDITTGDNICTEDGCSSSCYGFTCTKGWDPVSGLGSPHYPNMLNYIKTNVLKEKQ